MPPDREVFDSYTEESKYHFAAVGNVTATWRRIVKVCVCCGDVWVCGEFLRAKEEVWGVGDLR